MKNFKVRYKRDRNAKVKEWTVKAGSEAAARRVTQDALPVGAKIVSVREA